MHKNLEDLPNRCLHARVCIENRDRRFLMDFCATEVYQTTGLESTSTVYQIQ